MVIIHHTKSALFAAYLTVQASSHQKR